MEEYQALLQQEVRTTTQNVVAAKRGLKNEEAGHQLHQKAGYFSDRLRALEQPCATTTKCPKVLQPGSLATGGVFAAVRMQYQSKQPEATLLVDAECNMDINISEDKAAQLGLPVTDNAIRLQMRQLHVGQVQRKYNKV